jgi:hypothetical protein
MSKSIRSLEEIRAAAKGGKGPQTFTTTTFSSNHPQPVSSKISVLTPSAGSLAPTPMMNNQSYGQRMTSEDQRRMASGAYSDQRGSFAQGRSGASGIYSAGYSSSRAGTPDTVDEEPPAAFAMGPGQAMGFELTVNHSK